MSAENAGYKPYKIEVVKHKEPVGVNVYEAILYRMAPTEGGKAEKIMSLPTWKVYMVDSVTSLVGLAVKEHKINPSEIQVPEGCAQAVKEYLESQIEVKNNG